MDARPSLRRLYLPSLALIAVPAVMIARSLTFHNYPRYALHAQNESYRAAFLAGFVLAALTACWPRARRAVVGHFEKLSLAPKAEHVFWIAAAYLGIVAWLGFPRFCQIRSFQMPADTANSVNSAYGFIHHGVLEFTPFGVKSFAVQPLLLMAVYSPILMVWNSPYALYFLQHALVCSAPIAVYALVFALTSSSLAGFSALLLSTLNPYFLKLVNANLTEAAMAAFVVWALAALQLGRRRTATAFILLALCCSWEVPFVSFGLGLYLAWLWRDRRPRGWSAGAAVCAASAVLWLAELGVVKHYQALETGAFGTRRFSYWMMFSHLVPPGTDPNRIPIEIFEHLIRTATHFLHPYMFAPLVFLLASTGFLSLLAPLELIPLLFTAIPHVLSISAPHPTALFSTFSQHNGAPAFGLLLFATAYGIRRAYSWLAARDAQAWLLACALLVPYFTINISGDTGALMPDWRPQWFDAMPRMIARIPPKARVWADDYAAAAVANRRWLKAVSYAPGAWYFGDDDHVFKPDYVLLDSPWLDEADRPFREKILTYLSRGGYAPVAADTGIILWKAPEPSMTPDESPEWIRLPEPDPAAAAAFAGAAKTFVLQQDRRRETAESLVRLREETLIRPESVTAEGRLKLGMLLAGQGKIDEAVAQYALALRLKPGDPGAHFALGVAYAGRGKLDDAIREYAAAIEAKPDFTEALCNMGLSLYAQGKLSEAIPRFERALRANPGYAPAHFGLGAALAAQGKANEALREYGLASRANPGMLEPHYNAGNLYAKQGKVREAIREYRLALAIKPDFAPARANLDAMLARLPKN